MQMKEQDAKLERELADMREKVRKGTAQADAGELIPAEEVFGGLRRRHAPNDILHSYCEHAQIREVCYDEQAKNSHQAERAAHAVP